MDSDPVLQTITKQVSQIADLVAKQAARTAALERRIVGEPQKAANRKSEGRECWVWFDNRGQPQRVAESKPEGEVSMRGGEWVKMRSFLG